MKKIHTSSQLQDYLDMELSWRIKEIANLKTAVKSSKNLSEQTIIRAGLALLYAHWEGFIKNGSEAYVNYVNCQGLKYKELNSCFIVLGLKKSLNDLGASRKSKSNIVAIDFILNQLEERSQLKVEAAINTESNLSSEVFANILLAIGLDASEYETKYNLIDESLLRRRNHIAHGEFIEVGSSDWSLLADEILGLLRKFKTDIENSSSLESYKIS